MTSAAWRTAGGGGLALAHMSSRTLFLSLALLLGAGIFAPLQSQLNVALICSLATCADANLDVPLRNHLSTTLGHTVTNFDDNDQTWTPTLYDVVAISESAGSSNNAWLKAEAVGIFFVEGFNWDELEIGTAGDNGGGDTQINITDNSHYITAVFPTGVRTVTTVATNLGSISGWANGVTKLAHYNSSPTLAKLVYVDNGGVLNGGVNTAAERRAFFGAQYFANLTADGITLFNRAFNWAAYNTADHMVVTATDGAATTGGTEVLTFQLVDDLGNPVSKALAIAVTVTGSATFTANDVGGTNGSNSLTGTLSAGGLGSVTITDAVAETVTVTSDATGDNQAVANVGATVVFSAAPCPPATLPFTDDFNRANSSTVGNCWAETESAGNDATISTNRLVFVTNDVDNFPIVERSFTAVSSGLLKWTFAFDWARVTAEGSYSLFMQLGNSATFAAPPLDGASVAGAAINLRWGDDKFGFTAEEGFGYVQGITQTQVATVTGLHTIEVMANLNTETFNLKIDGATVASGVSFDKSLASSGGSIDAVRLYQGEGISSGAGGNKAFDDLTIGIVSAAVTGTLTPSATEGQIVSGGETLIITLTNDTLVAAGAPFDAQRQNIINGLTSAGVEATGWNAVVQAGLAVTDVVRTSNTVVTVTLPAFASYNVTVAETITVTVPATAVAGGGAIVATPTFDITTLAVTAALTGTVTDDSELNIQTGSSTLILTLTNDSWVAGGAAFDAERQNIINGLTSAGGEAAGWNAVVKVGLAVTDVVRTNNTAVTITLPAFPGYDILVQETITATVPATAVAGPSALVATPTFEVIACSTGGTITGSSIRMCHTTSGANRLMLVGVSINNDFLETVTSVTYNGVPLDTAGTHTHVGGGGDDARVEIWKLVAPSTGTHEVVITFNTGLTRGAVAGVTTFTGVDQTTPLGTFAGAHATSTLATVAVPSAAGETVFGVVASETPGGLTPGAPQAEQWNFNVNGDAAAGAGSTQPGGAPTVTTSWTLGGTADYWAIAGVSIKPAPPPSAAITGTLTPSATEAQIVSGSETMIITLTNDTWVAAGGTFDAQRQNIINDLTSAGGEPAGWNAVVQAGLAVTDVVRTNNTVVTVTLPAFASYNVTVAETITVTVPATAVAGGSAIVATPTFDVTAVAPAALLVRYWIDEAPSGQAPTQLIDDQATPLNLPITYDGANQTYTVVSTGRGWESTTTNNQGRASILVDGTKLQTTLNGATAATLELVLRVDALNTSSSRLIHIGDASDSGYLTLSSPNATTLYFYLLGGTLRGQWNPGFDGTRAVFHLVYNSTEPTAGNRVRLYKNGALVTKTGGTDPPLNETLSIPNGKYFAVGNRELCCRSFDGNLYYAAIYDGALTASEVSTNYAALLVTDDNITLAVAVTLNGVDSLPRLPSNGTSYAYKYTVTNNSSVLEDFDLFGYPGDTLATFLTVDSIIGPNVTGGAAAASASDSAFVWYSVVDVAAGTLDSLYLEARSISSSAVSDSGWVFIEVVKPNLTTGKAVSPNGTQLPGTELTYTVTITNDGTDDATGVVVLDSVAVELDFKVGSVVNNLPTGVSATVEYSNDAGSSWTYTPVSAGCGAPATFDSCVTHIRWTLDNDLSYVGPDNTGNVEFVTRIQ